MNVELNLTREELQEIINVAEKTLSNTRGILRCLDNVKCDEKIVEGSYVYDTTTNRVGQVKFIETVNRYSEDIPVVFAPNWDNSQYQLWKRVDKLRLATEAEVEAYKFWKSHDRDVWELKESDVLISKCHPKHFLIVEEVDFISTDHDSKEAMITFYSSLNKTHQNVHSDELKKHYDLLCFAKDRRDVNTIYDKL